MNYVEKVQKTKERKTKEKELKFFILFYFILMGNDHTHLFISGEEGGHFFR